MVWHGYVRITNYIQGEVGSGGVLRGKVGLGKDHKSYSNLF